MKYNTNPIFTKIFVITFVAILLTNLFGIGHILVPIKDFPFIDNRPTSKISIPKNLPELKEFPKQFDSTINDRSFFRNRIITLKNSTQLQLTRESTSDRVIVSWPESNSNKPWLYYNMEKAATKNSEENLFTDAELKKWVDEHEFRKEFLESQGIKYYVFIAPIKNYVYDSYLDINFEEKNSRPKQILKEIQRRNSDLQIVYPIQEVKAAKNNGEKVFYRTDSHWNQEAGYIGYKELFDVISQDFPNLKPIPKSEFQTYNKDHLGDLMRLLGIYELEKETRYEYPGSDISYNKEFVTELGPKTRDPYRGFVLNSQNPNPKTDLKAVFFRDSFMDALIPFTATHFSEVSYPTIYGAMDKSIIEEVKPDIVVQHMAQHNLFKNVDYFHEDLELYKNS